MKDNYVRRCAAGIKEAKIMYDDNNEREFAGTDLPADDIIPGENVLSAAEKGTADLNAPQDISAENVFTEADDFMQVTASLTENANTDETASALPADAALPAETVSEDVPEDEEPVSDAVLPADEFTAEASADIDDMTDTEEITETDDVDEETDDLDSENASWSDPIYRKSEDNKVYSPNHYGEKNGYSSYSQPIYRSPSPERTQESRPRMSAVALILVAAIICSLFSGLSAWIVTDYKIKHSDVGKQVILGSSSVSPVSTSSDSDSSDNTETLPAFSGTTTQTLSGSQIYKLALQQVVGVNSEKTTSNFFGQPTTYPVSGSGFIISEDGYILTNYHVIEYAVLYDFSLKVILSDGSEYPAKIIGYEEQNDVAVIKIDATGLSPVSFANSDNMNVGERVYPVGNPLGELAYSMTSGIVSATDRVISTDKSTKINMFQIDAAVNKGNSGGPVYNEYGEVLGIVTAKYSDDEVEGIGFAIPINDVLDIVTQLIETGYIGGKPRLGVEVQTVDSQFSNYYNVPLGAYVMTINPGSCAEKAGLKVGDIITAIGSQKVTTKEELITALGTFKAGDTTTLTVFRSGEETKLTVVLDEKLPVNS